jgi:hypothetical protein
MLRLVENHSLPRTAAFFDLDKTVIAKSSTLTFSKSFYQGGLINRHAQAFGRVARTVDFGLYSSEFADRGSRTITGGRPLHARLPVVGLTARAGAAGATAHGGVHRRGPGPGFGARPVGARSAPLRPPARGGQFTPFARPGPTGASGSSSGGVMGRQTSNLVSPGCEYALMSPWCLLTTIR